MKLLDYIYAVDKKIDEIQNTQFFGKIVRISGVLVEAVGLKIPVGSICSISSTSDKIIMAEVIGFSQESTYLIAFDEPAGVLPGAKIKFIEPVYQIPVGKELMGRVIGGFCQPIDNHGELQIFLKYSITGKVINPITRHRITKPMDVGVKAINALLTPGIGQRLGIFAGSGVGKSMLLGMITRFTEAEVVVVGLIGERGREVKEFIEENIGADCLKKTVVVAAPINTSPLERANGVLSAVSIAEYFRDSGMKVLLIVDSLTRYAHALRTMYLLLGEPPSSRGYPPSVFAKISQLVERCGNGCDEKGSITAFFTVLIEADDMNDPVADYVRSILDGHIVLSRTMAESMHYPAIDVSASVSRVMASIITEEHNDKAARFKKLYAYYLQNQDLVKMGMYREGNDRLLDEAIKRHESFNAFLRQKPDEKINFNESLTALGSTLDDLT